MTYMRLRHVAQVNPSSPDFDRLPGDVEVSFLRMESVWPGKWYEMSEVRKKSDVISGFTRFQNGDILVPKITPTFEASRSILVDGLNSGAGAGTTELHVVRPGCHVYPRFLLYLMHSYWFLRVGEAEMYGVAGQKRVPDDFLKNFEVWVPGFDEQRRIADFLDAEVDRIGRLMESRASQLRLLRERFYANVARKTGRSGDWGAESVGGLMPLRRAVFDIQTGATPSVLGGPAWSLDKNVGEVPWYNPGSLGDLMDLGSPKGYVMPGLAPRFRAGSVLFVGIGESIGKIAYLDQEASGNQQITAIYPNEKASGRFLAWQLWSALDEFRNSFPYSRVRIVNNDDLLSFSVCLPCLDVQERVVDELEDEVTSLGKIRDSFYEFEVLIEERKRALITAAVTGQIDVTTARGVDLS